MNKTIYYLNKERVDSYWDQIKDFLNSGLMLAENEMDLSQLRMLVLQGMMHVFIAVDDNMSAVGAMAIETKQYPNYRAAHIVSLGGKNMLVDEYDMNQIKQIFKEVGVKCIEGWCKPAQARLFSSKLGFRTPYQLIRMDLEGE